MNHSPDPRRLRIADYSYDLPETRIARYPLARRDAARLLVYRRGEIEVSTFHHLARYIPEGSTLVLNTAKVVRARMIFQKPTGGTIEIFCLEPHQKYADITTAMARTERVLWQCLVGGAAKWKEGLILQLTAGDAVISAEMISRNEGDYTIQFTWTPDTMTFAEVLERAGRVPLPPYMGRDAEQTDESRYQTLFATHEGSVAAPTASLHFTPGVLDSLTELGVDTATVTLHVGAGTFMPVKSDLTGDHRMHHEWIEVNRDTIEQLLAAIDQPIVAGGTTALRTIESLYWIGCKIMDSPDISQKDMAIHQWEAYEQSQDISVTAALSAILGWLERYDMHKLITRTGILIAPGYRFRLVSGLITNFHQPQSTLILLVAAFIGEDWQKVYRYALEHDFRFLSYGDGSLLWRQD